MTYNPEKDTNLEEEIVSNESLKENQDSAEEVIDFPPVKKIEISDEDKRAAANLSWELSTTNQINKAQSKKDTGAESYTAPVVSMESSPKKDWRNFKTAMRMAWYGLLGVGAAAGTANEVKAEGKNPGDSLKNKIEKVSSISKESNEIITQRFMTDWNKYIDWLDSKGLKGDASLDHNDKGMIMLKQYINENPNTSLDANEKTIVALQKQFSKYRDYCLQEIEAGRAQFGQGVTEENFMRALSVIDGIPGQRTVSFKFPEAYLKTLMNNSVIKFENQGFAKIKNVNTDKNSIASSDFNKNNIKYNKDK